MRSPVRNFIYTTLLNNYSRMHRLGGYQDWVHRITNPQFEASILLHGARVVIPSTYTYPLICRMFPGFNNPYLQLVHEVYTTKNRKLNIIDAGAAVGDTFLFIVKNIPQAVGKLFCVEGHPGFFKYLQINTRAYPEATIIGDVLSDKDEPVRELVHTHPATASAQGKNQVTAKRLDNIIPADSNQPIDILKIDVDGFDGKVLAGSEKILSRDKPSVIFEYHPGLLKNTGNDWRLPFAILAECRYERLVWFNKYGQFSHFMLTGDTALIERLTDECLEDGPEKDTHYDVIALPADTAIDAEKLAACEFAKHKAYPY